ncbi:hypothetical protein [Microbacterium album]|uniref:Uncharacterized protein n=1 Tax=Microbacterium album TaxID=2053191 RepID=A0A917IFC1_9MICO|nr:hypothetical protein [Microbacterium album]GGH40704.1 hypothetical protein GCM10010921_12810 [Microbacterium album]
MRRVAASAGIVAVLAFALTACAAPDSEAPRAEAPATSEDPPASGALPEMPQREGEVPQECQDAYPLAVVPADLADVASVPDDWPAPPAGAVLCLTSGSFDDTTETASYATDAPIEDVLAHYEAALAGYELYRADGAENGTGYDTLDGERPGLGVQIRETDGGFVIVFARAGA